LAERFEGLLHRTAVRVTGGFLAVLRSQIGTALAYPTVDPTNQTTLPTGAPTGSELPDTDVNGLQNQLRLTNPAAVPNANAWTIIPRITVQELFTDNVAEVQSPRRADAITVISPGISAVADTAHLKLNLDYQPDLMLHAIDGPLNAMTQHLTGTGLVTIVPDLAFVDLRALSGVQSTGGALATVGSLGTTNGPQYATPGQTGVNPRNEVQTSSVGISPYLLRQFKDYGTGKLGVSVDASRYSSITGFAANPFSGNGANAQSLLTTEQIAQFTTGEFLGRFQSAFSADFLQSKSWAQTGATVAVTTAAGTVLVPANSFTSQRQTIMDTVTYQVNRNIALIGGLGEQQIHYSDNSGPEVNGLTWKAGFTLTPSEESAITLTYGRFNGIDGFQANGHLALTERTLFSFDYSNTVGTQLESLQNQLNNSTVGPTGQLINSQTGGPNFIATNTLGVQTGVFRYQTLNASLSTTWLRDQLQAYATWSIQTNATPGNLQTSQFVDPVTGQLISVGQPGTSAGTGQTLDVKTVNITWLHELTPDLTLNSGASYSFVHRSGDLGNDGALAGSIGLEYLLSASATLSGRYAFYDRVSKIPGYNLYENILLVGFTKHF